MSHAFRLAKLFFICPVTGATYRNLCSETPQYKPGAFDLRDIHALFQEDHASSSINLDGIMQYR